MATRNNLLQSDGGVQLLPEICLKIVEDVVRSDARFIGSLLQVSKAFNNLLKKYEKSITKCVTEARDEFVLVNSEQDQVASPRLQDMQQSKEPIKLHSFMWLSEMQNRCAVVEYLLNHKITGMVDERNSWPKLDISKDELIKRQTIFKRNALFFLYQLADSAAGLSETKDIRVKQSQFLEGLSSVQLASLGIIVEVVGDGFFNITKESIVLSGMANISLRSADMVTPFRPSSVPVDDLLSDNWIRECMCVFEDLVQRYGPYFAWAYLEGSLDTVRKPHLWARKKIHGGWDNMNAFEMGRTMSYASLQSVVWKVFCKKMNLAITGSWTLAKEMVEIEMESYTLDE